MTGRETEPSVERDRDRPTADTPEWPCQDPRYVAAASAAAGWSTVSDGGFVLPFRRVGPFRQIVLPPFASYSAIPVGPSPGQNALLDHIERVFDDLVVHFSPESVTTGQILARGWAASTLSTYLLDPSIAADPASWSESARRNFRRHAAELEIVESDTYVSSVCDLVLDGYRRSGHRPPLASTRIPGLARTVVASGLGTCWVARSSPGRIEAGVILLSKGSRSSYWLAGSVPGPAMTVLLGRLFARLAGSGFTEFDFVGANTPSIAEFKRRFGGRRVMYVAGRYTPNRVLRRILAATKDVRRWVRS